MHFVRFIRRFRTIFSDPELSRRVTLTRDGYLPTPPFKGMSVTLEGVEKFIDSITITPEFDGRVVPGAVAPRVYLMVHPESYDEAVIDSLRREGWLDYKERSTGDG